MYAKFAHNGGVCTIATGNISSLVSLGPKELSILSNATESLFPEFETSVFSRTVILEYKIFFALVRL